MPSAQSSLKNLNKGIYKQLRAYSLRNPSTFQTAFVRQVKSWLRYEQLWLRMSGFTFTLILGAMIPMLFSIQFATLLVLVAVAIFCSTTYLWLLAVLQGMMNDERSTTSQ